MTIKTLICIIRIVEKDLRFTKRKEVRIMGKSLKGKELGKGISQRKDSRYVGRYIDAQGVRRSIYNNKLSELRRQLVEAQYKTNNNISTHGSDMTVDAWFEKWLETYKIGKVKPQTLSSIRSSYRIAYKPYIGAKRLKDVTPFDIQNIINQEYERGLAVSSIKERFVMLKGIFTKAYNLKIIPNTPCIDLSFPKDNKQKKYACKERRALSREEEKFFLEILPNKPWGYLLKLLLYTGLRVGEACALQWKHIDFEHKMIYVEQNSITYSNNGKYCREVGATKTLTSNRLIPMTRESYVLLTEYRLKRSDVSEENFLFVTSKGHLYNAGSIGNVLNVFLKRKNMDLNVTPHILRHTFATRCFEAGISPKVIQTYLGHTDITTTMNIYTHVDVMELKNNITKVYFA
mgnify:CR=1 FL=1